MKKWEVLQGNVLRVLARIPDNSVHMVITSPPYWGLRDYGLRPSIWGGTPGCKHRWVTESVVQELRRGVNLAKSRHSRRGGAKKIARVGWRRFERGTCQRCGAWRGVYGLEPTMQMYLDHTVEIFRAIRRVLRADGTLWLNLGDCSANDGKWGGETGGKQSYLDDNNRKRVGREKRRTGLKPKDRAGIPWRVAFALQADGWFLRRDIIWSKPNPMPESVKDRCTTAHEYLFHFSKSKIYFYDYKAIEEPSSETSHPRGNGVTPKARKVGRNSRELIDADPRHGAGDRPREKNNESWSAAVRFLVPTRNRRSVWEIATESYEDAHFATFPTALCEIPILAGTSEHGCCVRCGAPWKRIVMPSAETKQVSSWDMGEGNHKELTGRYQNPAKHRPSAKRTAAERLMAATAAARANGQEHDNPFPPRETLGWEPTCKCKQSARRRPALVLDPFSGSGTAGVVALRLGRRFLGVDAKREYCEMARRRILNDRPLFNQPKGEQPKSEQLSLLDEPAASVTV